MENDVKLFEEILEKMRREENPKRCEEDDQETQNHKPVDSQQSL